MRTVPLTLKEANAVVASLHRHHKPVVGHRWSTGLLKRESLVGAVIVGRPVARGCDFKKVAEVTRLVTDGTKNACSFAYAVSARIAREMGFELIQTYILESEPATSLVAAGWELLGETRGGHWCRSEADAKTRRDDQPECKKQRWGKVLKGTK
jgi:hypothetical protein